MVLKSNVPTLCGFLVKGNRLANVLFFPFQQWLKMASESLKIGACYLKIIYYLMFGA